METVDGLTGAGWPAGTWPGSLRSGASAAGWAEHSQICGFGGSECAPTHSLSPSSPQDFLQGDCTKAKQKLSWKPRVTFDVSCPLAAVEWAGVSPGETHDAPRPECQAETPSLPVPLWVQELVREMVDADVELMRNNPNA